MADGLCTFASCSLTFLATLFVLLFVSCAIVLRSFFLRRRLRRDIELQIAAGILPPEAALHFHRGVIDFGEKPKLWDVAITHTPEDLVSSWDHLAVRHRHFSVVDPVIHCEI